MGTVESTGAFVRVSAGARDWERAEKKARLMDADAADPTPARVTVKAAPEAFIAKKQGQRLSHSWLYKFSLMQRELVSFAQGRGLTYIDEFTDDELGLLSRSWKVAPITATTFVVGSDAVAAQKLSRPRDRFAALGGGECFGERGHAHLSMNTLNPKHPFDAGGQTGDGIQLPPPHRVSL
jgi:hypothetical protein